MSRIPLRSYCVKGCKCGSKEVKNWQHEPCNTQSYINNKGEISCSKGCPTYFIKNACFKCDKGIGFDSHKTATEFLLSLASTLQNADFTHNDDLMINFITNLNSEVIKRWHQ